MDEMKITNVRGRRLCVQHCNGMVPRGRYIGCDACELLIAKERDVPAIQPKTPPKNLPRALLSTADELRRLRGGKPSKRRKTIQAPERKKPPALKTSLELQFRKLWPLDPNGYAVW